MPTIGGRIKWLARNWLLKASKDKIHDLHLPLAKLFIKPNAKIPLLYGLRDDLDRAIEKAKQKRQPAPDKPP